MLPFNICLIFNTCTPQRASASGKRRPRQRCCDASGYFATVIPGDAAVTQLCITVSKASGGLGYE